jgi:hypothetical protein
MKNYFLLICAISVLSSCVQYPEKPEIFTDILVDSSARFIQIAPMGSAQITNYSIKGLVVDISNDIAKVQVPANTSYGFAIIPVSVLNKGFAVGDSATVTAEKWSGGYEGGWNYSIKK